MKIVADESVDFRIVAALRAEGYEVWAVVEEDGRRLRIRQTK